MGKKRHTLPEEEAALADRLRAYHALEVDHIAALLGTSPETGLEPAEAERRRQVYGPNELQKAESVKFYMLIIRHLFNFMSFVLFAAFVMACVTQQWIDAGVIAFLIFINTVIGVSQEYKSEKTMEALKKMSSPTSRVIRGQAGTPVEIPSSHIVPGDLVLLAQGDRIPADLRLVEVVDLECDEALLTGESIPVEKTIKTLGCRVNMPSADHDDLGNDDDDDDDETHYHSDDKKGKGKGLKPMKAETGEPDPPTKETKTKKEEKENQMGQENNRPADDIPIGDRTNVAFMSSTVTKGRAKGIAMNTGQRTELGKIADSIASQPKNKTELEKRMLWLGVILAIVALIAVGFVLLGLWLWDTLDIYPDGLQVAVATAVAIIPEALLPVITLCLTLGVRRMAIKKALVRKLASLEQLGNVSDICSDKTGTLTQGKMVATDMWLPAHTEHYYSITGKGFDPTDGFLVRKVRKVVADEEGEEEALDINDNDDDIVIRESEPSGPATRHGVEGDDDDIEMQAIRDNNDEVVGKPVTDMNEEPIRMALLVAALCNNSSVSQKEPDNGETAAKDNKKRWLRWRRKHRKEKQQQQQEEEAILAIEKDVEWVPVGSPTEVALYVMARKLGVERTDEEITKVWEKQAEYPFDSTIKLMSVVMMNKVEGMSYLFSKGAPERLLPKCTRILSHDGEEEELDAMRLDEVKEMNELMAEDGLRVLALAYAKLSDFQVGTKRHQVECELVFVGLVGIKDPPREGVTESIEICRNAGITVHMLTGDHPSTSTAIARHIGIIDDEHVGTDAVMTSTQFDKLTPQELFEKDNLPLVIARCSPESKVKMVQALHERRKIVAMTGDGVNDSPAISAADVGISMGISGSDVTKEASDIILTDDDFSTVVRAIEEGRRIFANIRRFIVHLMAGNVAEGIILVLGICSSLDPPLNPLQILWINLVTGTPPAMVLSVQPSSKDLMNKKTRPVDEGLFTAVTIIDILFYGTLMGALGLGSFVSMVYGFETSLKEAQATTYITLTLLLLAHAYNCRRLKRSMFGKQVWKAYGFHLSFLFGIGSVCFTLYVPKVNDVVFHSVAPGRWAWVLGLGSMALFIALSELYKLLVHRLLYHVWWVLRGSKLEAIKAKKRGIRMKKRRRRALRRFAIRGRRNKKKKKKTDTISHMASLHEGGTTMSGPA